MRPVSAADSVSLAVQRTRQLLFSPFKWGPYLKLGLVAIVTEGIGGNSGSSSHGGPKPGFPSGPGPQGPMAWPPFHLAPEWLAAIVAAVLVLILLSLVVFYLVTRLRFAFFHCLIHNTTEIGPGWRLYAAQATRFFWFNLVVAFCYLLLMALAALPFIAGFIRLFRELPPGGQPGIGPVLALVLPMIPVILLLVLVGVLIDVIVRDCILPHYALENATAGEAWEEVWDRIRDEKLQFFVYALLRLILPVIATIGAFLVLLLPGLMVAGSVAAVEYGIHSAFADSTGASALAGLLLEGFFGVIALGFALLASICLGGPLSTGVREYALVFYGSRYQPLGDILYPPPPPRAAGVTATS